MSNTEHSNTIFLSISDFGLVPTCSWDKKSLDKFPVGQFICSITKEHPLNSGPRTLECPIWTETFVHCGCHGWGRLLNQKLHFLACFLKIVTSRGARFCLWVWWCYWWQNLLATCMLISSVVILCAGVEVERMRGIARGSFWLAKFQGM